MAQLPRIARNKYPLPLLKPPPPHPPQISHAPNAYRFGLCADHALFLQIFWALGAVTEVVLAILILEHAGWRWWLAASALPLVLFIPLVMVGVDWTTTVMLLYLCPYLPMKAVTIPATASPHVST